MVWAGILLGGHADLKGSTKELQQVKGIRRRTMIHMQDHVLELYGMSLSWWIIIPNQLELGFYTYVLMIKVCRPNGLD